MRNEEREKRKRKAEKLAETRKKAEELNTLINNQMKDYGDRLKEDDKKKVSEAREKLINILDNGKTNEDVEKIKEAMEKLNESSTSLQSAQIDNNKLLQSSAHEAIFAGEQILHRTGFQNGNTSPEAESVSNNIRVIKALVMAPEASWNRIEITTATNALTEARVKLEAKLDAQAVEKHQAEANAKALQEAKLAAQLEAEQLDDAVVDVIVDVDETPQVNVAEDMIIEDNMVTVGDDTPDAQSGLPQDPNTGGPLDLSNLPDNVVVIGVTKTMLGPIVMVTAEA